MQLGIDLDMSYGLGAGRNAMLAIEAARCPGQTIRNEVLYIDDAQIDRIPGESGVGTRMWAHLPHDRLRVSYRAEIEVTRPGVDLEGRAAAPIQSLPAGALTYTRPSRFCQSDEFTGFVANRFGGVTGGDKVAAIRDWVGSEIAYLQASSQANTTVLDTFARREGVCRDFAHMVCALCRAAGLPARYVSAYGLGVTPEDFHALAQVWLEDGWHLVDATGMCTPDGIVVIGVGRDACDAPFMETLDESLLQEQSVHVRRLDDRPPG